ncbi:F-box domain-containing protein [Mycena venus]|uniref:F-box domain-containing protein n=1 Tax=Mycena venus TaxID=2733690 RepID=A0A8H6XZ14_9AGAR|nr:F-box domain-containing protein [Mycena venus]
MPGVERDRTSPTPNLVQFPRAHSAERNTHHRATSAMLASAHWRSSIGCTSGLYLLRPGHHLRFPGVASSPNPGLFLPHKYSNHVPQRLRGRMPRLRKLCISLNADPGDFDGPATTVTAFSDAPELRDVILCDFPLQWIALPWAQLTSLELLGQGVSQSVEILQNTPNIEVLCLELVNFDDMPPVPVRLAHVHTLKFRQYHRSDIKILDFITLPALEDLELSMVEHSTVPRFVEFLARSGCVLRSLALGPTDYSSTLQFLRAAPTVSVVHLKDMEWNIYGLDTFFTILARELDILPNLRSLSLNPFLYALEVPYAHLAALLASRRQGRDNGGARLESFELILSATLGFEPDPSVTEVQEGLDALRALEDSGLKVNIRSLQKMTDSVDATARKNKEGPTYKTTKEE